MCKIRSTCCFLVVKSIEQLRCICPFHSLYDSLQHHPRKAFVSCRSHTLSVRHHAWEKEAGRRGWEEVKEGKQNIGSVLFKLVKEIAQRLAFLVLVIIVHKKLTTSFILNSPHTYSLKKPPTSEGSSPSSSETWVQVWNVLVLCVTWSHLYKQ